jgi:hydroxymethylglutaryl-CoA reductase (NADPH)
MSNRKPVPRIKGDNYSEAAAQLRRDFIEAETGVNLKHTGHYSIDPNGVEGNAENFIGVVQMPVGIAGPYLINGEHAQGTFYVPMATTEGTLIASYSRGMRVISESGGATTTVIEESMQRAPLFEFASAREALHFSNWLEEQINPIRQQAESTTSIGKLQHIQKWVVANKLFTRFNYSTGDAAGQNMTGKATHKACQWILANYPGVIDDFALSGGIETDKKHSHMNLLHSRGKRVVAEATINKDVIKTLMRADPERMFRLRQRTVLGALMAGSAYNGPHSANGIASMFIATGQDEANVVESHTGIAFMDLTPAGDLYYSVTLPSIICASYGGGTGLPTQRECLEMMDCYGQGKARKLAEIVAATVLAGDVSLAAAIVADEWVSSHDNLGRNRP